MNVPFADAGSSALQPNKFVVPFPEEGRRSGKESTPHGGSLQKSSAAMSDAIWLGVERNWSTIPTAADYYQIPIPKFSVTPVLCVSVVNPILCALLAPLCALPYRYCSRNSRGLDPSTWRKRRVKYEGSSKPSW
jgi:hypothetical protein